MKKILALLLVLVLVLAFAGCTKGGNTSPGNAFVSESGVRTAEDVAALQAAGVDAVLVGETLMRAADIRGKLAELRGEWI